MTLHLHQIVKITFYRHNCKIYHRITFNHLKDSYTMSVAIYAYNSDKRAMYVPVKG